MALSVHLRALLWREALFVRHSKLFAVLQLLVSMVLVAGAAFALSSTVLSSQGKQWVYPSELDTEISCSQSAFVAATPAAYASNATAVIESMDIPTSFQGVYPYSPGMNYPDTIFDAEMFINATGYAPNEAEREGFQPPYIAHVAATGTDEGTAHLFFNPDPNMEVGMNFGACFPFFFPLSFDAAAVPATQPRTSLQASANMVLFSLTPLLAVVSSMAVVAAMLPAVAGLAVRLTDDKASRLREHLRIMGMHNLAYYTALHAACAVRIVPVALIATIAITSTAPLLLHPSRAVAYFFCAALGGVSSGLGVHPIALRLRRPMLTTTATCFAVLSSAAAVFAVFMPAYVPQAAQWPLLFLCGAPAATVAALAGLVLEPLGGIGAVSPMASLAAAVLSGLFWGAVGEYRHARNPGEYGVPQPAGYPLWALLRLLRSCRPSATLIASSLKTTAKATTTTANALGEKAALLDAADIEAPLGGGSGPTGKAVEIRNLWKVFDEEEVAVSGLDLDVRYGEILALLGHNGAGKSTTVSVLTGMLPATRSECCKVGGRDVALDIDGVREVIGVCPQVDILMPDLSAVEHVRFFGALRGVDNRERGMELLQTLDLPLTEQKAGTYSGGMKRRLSLALALCTSSPVLFLDEPSSGLDPIHRRLVWDLLRKERAGGRGIVLTTHIMEEAEVLGDRVAIMAKGRLRCCDTTAALKARYGVGNRVHLLPGVKKQMTTTPAFGRCELREESYEQKDGQKEETEKETVINVDAVSRIVHEHLPRATVEARRHHRGGGLTITVPRGGNTAADDLDSLAAVLAAFENNPALGVRHCTTSQTTIEDVFLHMADPSLVAADDAARSPENKFNNVCVQNSKHALVDNEPTHSFNNVRESGLQSHAERSELLNEQRLLLFSEAAENDEHRRVTSEPRTDQHQTAGGGSVDGSSCLQTMLLADGMTTAGDLLLPPEQHTSNSGGCGRPPLSWSCAAFFRTFAAIGWMRLGLLLRGTYGLPLLLPLLIASGALASLSSTEIGGWFPISILPNATDFAARKIAARLPQSASVKRRDAGLAENAVHVRGYAAATAGTAAFSEVSPVANQFTFAGTIGLVYNEDHCQSTTTASAFADRFHACLQAAAASSGSVVPPLAVASRAEVLRGVYPLPTGVIIPGVFVPSIVFLDAMAVVANNSNASFFALRFAPSPRDSNFQWNDPFSALVPPCAQRAFSTMVAGLDANRSALPFRFGTLPTLPPSPPVGPPPVTGAPYPYVLVYTRNYTLLYYAVLCPLVGISATSAALPMLIDVLDRNIYAALRLHGAHAWCFWLGVSAADASVVIPALVMLLIAPYAMSIPELSGPGIFFMCAFAIAGVFAFNNLIASVLLLTLPRRLPMAAYVGIFACTSFVLTAAFASPHLIAPSDAKQILGMLNIGAALSTTLKNEPNPVPAAAVTVGVLFSIVTLVALAVRLLLEPVWTALFRTPRPHTSTASTVTKGGGLVVLHTSISNKVGGGQSTDDGNGSDAVDVDVRAEASTVMAWRQGPSSSPVSIVAALVGAWRVFSRPPLQAVRGVSCGVRLGECFGLLGPNGAGKTTAVGLLTAQDGATSGEVCVGDSSGQVPVHRYAPSADRLASQEALHAALPMSLCSQHDTLFPTMTAEQHLLFYLSLRTAANGPWQPALWTEYVSEVLRRVGLSDVIGTKKSVTAYSGGMKRKLQVAIAMFTGGRLCVLDEPSTGMDPGARRLLWAAIHSALEGGERSVLLTTHSMEEAENACTRLAIMQHGQLRCIGTPDHLRARFGDGYTLTVGLPADGFDQGRLDALHAAVVETLVYLSILVKAAAPGAGVEGQDQQHPAGVPHTNTSVSAPVDDCNNEDISLFQPTEVLGGRVLVYKVGRLPTLSCAYAALARLHRRFPSITTSLAQQASLEQIFIALVGRGRRTIPASRN